jgi:hypothetical protein
MITKMQERRREGRKLAVKLGVERGIAVLSCGGHLGWAIWR